MTRRRGDVDGVRVVQHSPHKHGAEQAHDGQQHGADDREAKDAAEHDIARPDRLGDERVDYLGTKIIRQAERAHQQRNQQYDVGGGGKHEAEKQLAWFGIIRFEEPTGAQQDDDVDAERHEDAAANGFLDRQAGDGPHAAGRCVQQFGDAVDDDVVGDVARRQRPVPHDGDEESGDQRQNAEREGRAEKHDERAILQGARVGPRVADQPR